MLCKRSVIIFPVLALILSLLLSSTNAIVRRCFFCRSRGDLGDCRDPFYLSANSTIIESKQAGVETPPCSSGWCAKIEEGEAKLYKDAEYGAATERSCLQRPPSDGKERCADVEWNRKRVHMCFCKGDLCNSSGFNKIDKMFIFMAVSVSIMRWL